MEFMQQYIMPFIHLLLEMAPYLLLGFFIAGLLRAFLTPGFYNRYLGGNGFRPVIMAALMGVPLPLCSCGVIPTAMSLRRNGASRGATVSFLISTPQTGVDSILATGGLMGIPFAVIRPVAAFITALFGGGLVSKLIPENVGDTKNATVSDDRPAGFAARMKMALHYGFVDMMQDIGRWLVIGLIIAGLITIFIPSDLFTGLERYPLLNMLIILAISMPMYVCATGSIPIAVALMMKGLSPGAALVFLMAGPATNMAAIMVIGKVLKRRTTLIYILSIVTGAIIFGLTVDYCLPAEWFSFAYASECSNHATPIFNIVCAVALTVMLTYALTRRHSHTHDENNTTGSAPETRTFKVDGMSCNHCKASVENALNNLDGVDTADVNLPDGRATVTGHATDNEIVTAIEQLGFKCHPIEHDHA